jgi:transcriptional regulator GlxA family with amidase domain
MNVRIIIFDGVDEIDFLAPYTVFQRAAKRRPEVDVRLVTLEPAVSVVCGQGLTVLADGVMDAAPDLVFVPGGGWVDGAPHGVRAAIERGLLPETIARLRGQGSIIAGICTGVMALAAAGILQGGTATTHRSAMDDLRQAGVQVVEARVVDTGAIVTCGGVTSAFDLSLWLVERLWGAGPANRIAAAIEYPRSSDVRVIG